MSEIELNNTHIHRIYNYRRVYSAEIERWLHENNIEYVNVEHTSFIPSNDGRPNKSHMIVKQLIRIDNEEDAILFKLMWC